MYQFNEQEIEIKEQIENILIKEKLSSSNYSTVQESVQLGIEILSRLGYLGINIPSKYGGVELDNVSKMLIVKLLAKTNASLAHVFSAHVFGFVEAIVECGTEYQKDNLLPKLATGEEIGTLSITEPNGISPDVLVTRAERQGEYFVINGSKSMLTNAKQAKYALVLLKTKNYNKITGDYSQLSLMIVDLKKKSGLSFGKIEETMGLEGAQICDVHFDNYTVSEKYLLGKEGEGLKTLVKLLNYTRIANAAVALGIAEAALDEGIKYTKMRQLNKMPLMSNPQISIILTDVQKDIEICHLLTFYTASLLDRSLGDIQQNSTIAKLHVTETAKKICDSILQLHGGYGYLKDYRIEQLYRDIRITTII